LIVVRHKPVLEDSLKPPTQAGVSGQNGASSTDLALLGWTPVIGLWSCRGVSDREEEAPVFPG
jgi:hypothetical protein